MNVLNSSDDRSFLAATQEKLLGDGMEDLRTFAAQVARLRSALDMMKSLGDGNMERRAEKMRRQLETFEPSVTMIGQIKSGKTSLVNAMVGAPDLLPADVNPWTSVVTSLHLHPEAEDFQDSASFCFFDQDEWDKLISGGGRIGELASRAGADDELEKIKQQVARMREKSRARLGRKFEMLLGQQRDYGYFDKDLIERYVCLGEEPDEEEGPTTEAQGRFADITKSADLNMQRQALPIRLCLRDTPGVNDTFMMREQITIRAIRDSRICVVVLSAHQALTSTDMALIRLITHVKSRDVIIFVNRIDELSDPAAQVAQIRASIEETLRAHKGPENAEILFGSALWASFALELRAEELPPSSLAALKNWADGEERGQLAQFGPADMWALSGLPSLQAAIGKRIADGIGTVFLERVAQSAGNLLDGLAAADRISSSAKETIAQSDLSVQEARTAMESLIANQKTALQAAFDDILAGFASRMERVQDSFLDRATASLVIHLEKNGELTPWTYDPAGLRVLLSASHKVLARNSAQAFEAATSSARAEIAEIYKRGFGLGASDIDIAPPRAPQAPAPVTLGRTIALDLNGSWWKKWWLQRRGYQAYAASFYDLIKSETSPVISELRDDVATSLRDEACAVFDAFLSEQHSVFETLERSSSAGEDEMLKQVAASTSQERIGHIREARAILDAYRAP